MAHYLPFFVCLKKYFLLRNSPILINFCYSFQQGSAVGRDGDGDAALGVTRPHLEGLQQPPVPQARSPCVSLHHPKPSNNVRPGFDCTLRAEHFFHTHSCYLKQTEPVSSLMWALLSIYGITYNQVIYDQETICRSAPAPAPMSHSAKGSANYSVTAEDVEPKRVSPASSNSV